MRATFALRIRIVSILIALVAIFFIARLFTLQVVHGEDYSQRADHQYVQPAQALYDRGSIFFEDKSGNYVSAATLATGYTVAINPTQIRETDVIYNQLSNIIPIDETEFFLKVSRTDDPYEEIAHRISREQADQITALRIPGVQVHKDRWRFYPGKGLAAQTVGFVGYVGDNLEGRYGIERYYNHVLDREENGVQVNFFAEVFANVSTALFSSKSGEGDVVTSIEPSVQVFLDTAVENIHTTWDSKLTGAIVINPQNGQIYAMSVYPSFDANSFGDVEETSVFTNPLISGAYEMGSIIKPLTIAIGLDTGAVRADTEYVDEGFRSIDGYTIGNFDGKARGRVDMQEVLNQSLNTGVVHVVEEVGKDEFARYMQRLKLGEETGIDLPSEVPGFVDNLESPRLIEYATASFGQGIAMTPIATVRALSTLANEGIPVTPHVGKEIIYTSGRTKDISFAEEKRVFSKETSEEVTRMLVGVVDDALLNGTVKLDEYSVAAKTGTAQIAKVDERGYYDDRFLHSFFGYFPAFDPEFLIFFYTVEPKEVRYASQTLTMPFMDTVGFLINHYEIPPDRE